MKAVADSKELIEAKSELQRTLIDNYCKAKDFLRNYHSELARLRESGDTNQLRQLQQDFENACMTVETFEAERYQVNSTRVDTDSIYIRLLDESLTAYEKQLEQKVAEALAVLVTARREYSDAVGEAPEVFSALLIANNGSGDYTLKSYHQKTRLRRIDEAICKLTL